MKPFISKTWSTIDPRSRPWNAGWRTPRHPERWRKLNRSRKWFAAVSYAAARELAIDATADVQWSVVR
jgi:hypothetical protein